MDIPSGIEKLPLKRVEEGIVEYNNQGYFSKILESELKNMDNNSRQKDFEAMMKEGDELLNRIKNSNADFKQKTDKIIANINEKLDSTEKDFNETEKEIVDEIDKLL